MTKKGRVGIILSGRGSNFQAIYHYCQNETTNYQVAVVISNKINAPGLKKAAEVALPTYYVSAKQYADHSAYEHAMIEILKATQCELICLAGYTKLIGPTLLNEFKNRIMNIHPALLPAFKGLHAQEQALQYGVKVSGCTVHFVDEGMDTGPIILQRTVKVDAQDTAESLSQRILAQEHLIYPHAIELYFSGRLKIKGRLVEILPQ
jgi:phosphoribosylglycinamide formyltransferase-1